MNITTTELDLFQTFIQSPEQFTVCTDIPISNMANMAQIGDVDVSNQVDGSVLVYKMNTHKWTATTHLDAQDVEGGEF
jgi:hypothetical protein